MSLSAPPAGTRRWTPASLRASSDRVLVHQLVGGDDAALEAICARYRVRLSSYVRRLVPGAPVEEITQDVFVRFWATASRFDPERGSLSAFLHVTARGKAFDWARSDSARRQREESFGRLATERVEQYRHGEEVEIRDAVEALPTKERQAVWLAFYMGYTYRQVATILDIPEGTAKAQIRSSLRRLHNLLDLESTVVDADVTHSQPIFFGARPISRDA